jgi:hypothetical protein
VRSAPQSTPDVAREQGNVRFAIDAEAPPGDLLPSLAGLLIEFSEKSRQTETEASVGPGRRILCRRDDLFAHLANRRWKKE